MPPKAASNKKAPIKGRRAAKDNNKDKASDLPPAAPPPHISAQHLLSLLGLAANPSTTNNNNHNNNHQGNIIINGTSNNNDAPSKKVISKIGISAVSKQVPASHPPPVPPYEHTLKQSDIAPAYHAAFHKQEIQQGNKFEQYHDNPLASNNVPPSYLHHAPPSLHPSSSAPHIVHAALINNGNQPLSPVAKNRAKAMGSTIFNLDPSEPTSTITGRHRGRVMPAHAVREQKAREREMEVGAHEHSNSHDPAWSSQPSHPISPVYAPPSLPPSHSPPYPHSTATPQPAQPYSQYWQQGHPAAAQPPHHPHHSPLSPSYSHPSSDPTSSLVRSSWGGGDRSLEDGPAKMEAEHAKRMELKRMLDEQVRERQLTGSESKEGVGRRERRKGAHIPAHDHAYPTHPAYPLETPPLHPPSQPHYRLKPYDAVSHEKDRMKAAEQEALRRDLEEQIADKQRRKEEFKERKDEWDRKYELQQQQPFTSHLHPPQLHPSQSQPTLSQHHTYIQQPVTTAAQQQANTYMNSNQDPLPAQQPHVLSPSKLSENRHKAMASSVFGGHTQDEKAARDEEKLELRSQIEERRRVKDLQRQRELDEERKDNERVAREQFELKQRYAGVSPRTAAKEAAKLFGNNSPQQSPQPLLSSPPHSLVSPSHSHPPYPSYHPSAPTSPEAIDRTQKRDGQGIPSNHHMPPPFYPSYLSDSERQDAERTDHEHMARLLEITEQANAKVKMLESEAGNKNYQIQEKSKKGIKAASNKKKSVSSNKKSVKEDWRHGWGAGQAKKNADAGKPPKKPPVPKQNSKQEKSSFKAVYDDPAPTPPYAKQTSASRRRNSQQSVPTSPIGARSKSEKRAASPDSRVDVEVEYAGYDDMNSHSPSHAGSHSPSRVTRQQSGPRNKTQNNSPQTRAKVVHSAAGRKPNTDWKSIASQQPLDSSLHGNSEFILSNNQWSLDDGMSADELSKLMANFGTTYKQVPSSRQQQQGNNNNNQNGQHYRSNSVSTNSMSGNGSYPSHIPTSPISQTRPSISHTYSQSNNNNVINNEDSIHSTNRAASREYELSTNRTPRMQRSPTLQYHSSYTHSQHIIDTVNNKNTAMQAEESMEYSNDFVAMSPNAPTMAHSNSNARFQKPKVYDPFQQVV